MMDYCLKMDSDEQFDDLMLDTGLGVEVEDEEGLVTVVPASYLVLFDRIGPITMQTGVDESGDPVTITYPEYYVNLRVLEEVTEEQEAALAPYAIDPSQPQYRVWA